MSGRTLLALTTAMLAATALFAEPTQPQTDVAARLHWIGKTPQGDKPVSFGIPFNKG